MVLHRDCGISEILHEPPWVETIALGPEDMARAIRRMVASIAPGVLERQPRLAIPTETEWAQQIATQCGWL